MPHPAGAAPQAPNPIKHIVIIVKENRTFDSMFGTFPGADGATTYKDPNGIVHPLNHQPDKLFTDIEHDHKAYLIAYDNGKMDGFSKVIGAIQPVNGQMVDVADSQFYQSDIPNYWQYAQTFALPDHFFYTTQANSFAGHLFSIAGTDDDVGDIPVFQNPHDTRRWGCDAPKSPTVSWLVQPHAVSEHPSYNMCAGENWTVQQINSIMQNTSLWNSTAIFLTWDDFSGLYDHVVPPAGPNTFLEYGFRAPLIVI